jgi:hypothetical protein
LNCRRHRAISRCEMYREDDALDLTSTERPVTLDDPNSLGIGDRLRPPFGNRRRQYPVACRQVQIRTYTVQRSAAFYPSSYIYHRGGVLRFGKLTVTDADLEIVDENPKTPFDFSLPDYSRQLVPGYSNNFWSHGDRALSTCCAWSRSRCDSDVVRMRSFSPHFTKKSIVSGQCASESTGRLRVSRMR